MEKGFAASGDTDQAFLQGTFESICLIVMSASDVAAEVLAKRDQMDKGLHIGSWGQLQGQIYTRVVGLDSIAL